MAQLDLRSLRKEFGKFLAVNDLTLRIDDGSFVALLGPSGCGKTTTLNMIAGLLQPTSGEILIDDEVVNDLSPSERKVGLVFQNYAVFPHMTVYENIAFGLRIRRLAEEDIKRSIEDMAHIFHLQELLAIKAGKLRLDEMQRVALARTFVTKPSLLLLDEPLSNLDAALRATTRAELKKLHRELRQTVVYVTHDQLEAMAMAEKIAIMDHGKLLQYDTPAGVYNRPKNNFVGNFIGSPNMNFLDCSLAAYDGGLFLDFGDFQLDVSRYRDALANLPGGSEVVLGIRPEHIALLDRPPAIPRLEGVVDVVELLGAKKIVNLRLGSRFLKAVVPAATRCATGERTAIEFDINFAHIMDRKTGESLT